MKTNKDILKKISVVAIVVLSLTTFASVMIVNIHRSLNGCPKVVYFDYVTLGLSRLSCEVK